MELEYEAIVCVLFFCGFLLTLSVGYGLFTAVEEGIKHFKRKRGSFRW